jgi:hypothetical protein
MYLGGPLSLEDRACGIPLGWIGMALAAWLIAKCRRTPAETALAGSVLFIVVTAFAVAIGRVKWEDLLNAAVIPLPAHYMTQVLTFWAALLGLAMLQPVRWPKVAAASCAGVLAFGMLPLQMRHARFWTDYFRENDAIASALIVGVADPALGRLNPAGAGLLKWSEALRARRLALFREDRARLLGRAVESCRAVQVERREELPGGWKLTGWMRDGGRLNVTVHSAGIVVGVGRAGIKRPDGLNGWVAYSRVDSDRACAQ